MSNSFEIEHETIEFENLANLAENLVYRLRGCPDLTIRKTIQSIYGDFCRRACALVGHAKYKVTKPLSKIPLCAVYDECFVDTVKSVIYNGRTMIQGRHYYVCDGAVVFNHEYNEGEFVITTIEVPTMTCEKAPCDFIKRHGEAIVNGVIARLMIMSNVPWADPVQAQIATGDYINACNKAKLDLYSQSSFANGELRGDNTRGVLI